MRILHTVVFAGGLVVSAALVQAQEVKAELTPSIDTPRIHAGQMVKARLNVHLPNNFRVPSDKPGNKFIPPTVLTIETPGGVSATIMYPRASPASLAGQKRPTMMIGPDFTILVQFTLVATMAAGTVNIPAKLRYEACNDSACYPMATVPTQWTLHVAGGH
jgi:DsbC/DsbD-like thiol-disulfide interchange protein